jgi:hypothetical protein
LGPLFQEPNEVILTVLLAGCLTLFDLDEVFYVPERGAQKWWLRLWWWGFVLLNGVLAGGLYLVFREEDGLKDMNRWGRAVAVGLGYLALIRLKLTTIRDVPVGLEVFYEKAKAYVYKRINRIAARARDEETLRLVQEQPLAELTNRAKLRLLNDALLSPEEKRKTKE